MTLAVHLGSVEKTQETRVALAYRLKQLLHFFRALQTSRVHHNPMKHAKAWTTSHVLTSSIWRHIFGLLVPFWLSKKPRGNCFSYFVALLLCFSA